MRLATLPSGVDIEAQQIDSLLESDFPALHADALVVPAAALTTHKRLDLLAQKIRGSNCGLVAILGANAEQVHDHLDTLLERDMSLEQLPATTWHLNESAEDILNMIEHMLMHMPGNSGQRSILVIVASCSLPQSIRELTQLLDSELKDK